MVCQGLEILGENVNITGIITFPTTCDYYFYLKFMFAIFVIIALGLYFKDREKLVRADFISCMGVSGLATIFISLAGRLLGIIPTNIFIYILIFCMLFIVIWLFKK